MELPTPGCGFSFFLDKHAVLDDRQIVKDAPHAHAAILKADKLHVCGKVQPHPGIKLSINHCHLSCLNSSMASK